MRVLITGVSGLCGEEIAKWLSVSGHNVTGLYRTHPVQDNFQTLFCDLSKKITIQGHFDVIIHCSGTLPYWNPSMAEYVSGNITSMENLLDYAHRRNIPRIIYLSTIGIYGDFKDSLIDENSPRIDPDNYGVTKFIAERLLAEDSQIESISLRCPGIIGKKARGVWLSNIAKCMKKDKTIFVSTPEFLTRNIVHIKDLAQFTEHLLHKNKWPDHEMVVASKNSMAVGDIIGLMKQELKSHSQIINVSANKKPFCLNPKRAIEAGYAPMDISDAVRCYCYEIQGDY